jgi:hypothetical protein
VPKAAEGAGEAKRLRERRRDLVHEKAVQISDVNKFYPAQEEAKNALSLVKKIREKLARAAPHSISQM